MAKVYKELYKMQTVYLKGDISKFGEVWKTNCSNLVEILKLIGCQSKGFDAYLINMAEQNRGLEIVKASEIVDCIEDFIFPLNDEDIIITEVPAGAGDNPFKTLIIGVAMIVAPVFATQASYAAFGTPAGFTQTLRTLDGIAKYIAMAGFSLALNGAAQLLAPGPETEITVNNEEEEKAKLFNGPENVARQGIPIPLLYGELAIGGVTIQSSLNIPENITKRSLVNIMEESLQLGDYA